MNRGRFVAFGGQFGELRLSCAACHQFNGAGDRSGAFPRLSDQSAWYLYATLHDFAAGTRPSDVMGPIARELSDADMQDVAAYYATVNPPDSTPAVGLDQSSIEQGRQIAESGLPDQAIPSCATCHGVQGHGSQSLYPFLAGQFAVYLERQLHRFKSGERSGDPMGVMQSIAAKLNDQQIHAVSQYFASLSAAQNKPQMKLIEATQKAKDQESTSNAASTTTPPHVGATKEPKPGKGDVVVPGTSPMNSSGQRKQ